MPFHRIAALLALLSGTLCLAQSPATEPTRINSLEITVGPDTTVFTGPLLPDGSVNYVVAINAVQSKDLQPKDNAVCELMRITDPQLVTPDDLERRAKVLRLLGLGGQIGDEVAWNDWPGFQHPIPADDPQNPGYVDRMSKAAVCPWSSLDMPEVADWLKSNEMALDFASRASRRPRFWIPLMADPKSGLFDLTPGITIWHHVANAFCVRSMLKLHQGNAPAALEDLLTVQRLGALYGQDSGPVCVLVGVGVQSMGCRSLWRLLQDSTLTVKQLRQMSADLLAIPPIPCPPRQVWQQCRYQFLAAVQFMASAQAREMLKTPDAKDVQKIQKLLDDKNAPVFLDWNRVLRLGNRFYDGLVKDRSSLAPAQRDAEIQAFNDWYAQLEQVTTAANVNDESRPPKWLFPKEGENRQTYSDRVGAILLMMTTPSFNRMTQTIQHSGESLQWTAKVGVALAIYRAEHGKYPDSLDALIPAYLASLPAHASAFPIGYERRGEGYVVRIIDNSPGKAALLARYKIEFDPSDILIRTDQFQ
jgi:hypothetical protein